MRIIIVDDEAPARDELRYLLEKLPGVEVIATARNGNEALERIFALGPDVAFLDIQMPDMSGLAVARSLLSLLGEKPLPLLVFATAYDQHALEAFEVNAIDYILKPFSEERLQQTIERLKRILATNTGNDIKDASVTLRRDKLDQILSILENPSQKPKLPVEVNERIILLDLGDIFYAGVEGRHVRIKTKDNFYETNYSLSELEARLGLLQTHKSFLVNKDMVREIVPWFNGTYNLILGDKEKSQVPVSRTYVRAVKQALHL